MSSTNDPITTRSRSRRSSNVSPLRTISTPPSQDKESTIPSRTKKSYSASPVIKKKSMMKLENESNVLTPETRKRLLIEKNTKHSGSKQAKLCKKDSKQSTMNLTALCPELKFKILRYLHVDELLTLSLVSKSWYYFISSGAVWLERFRMLKPIPLPPLPTPLSTEEFLKLAVDFPTPYNVSPLLSSSVLRELKKRKFLTINETKLAFFLNKAALICNRLIYKGDLSQASHAYCQYFPQQDENLMWSNYDENFAPNTRFKVYHIRGGSGTGYHLIHIRNFGWNDQIIDAGVRYSSFMASDRFMLAQFQSLLHVYRFNYETSKFERTHALKMTSDHILMAATQIILGETRVIVIGRTFVWEWDLMSGKKLGQIKLASYVKSEERLVQAFHAKDSRLVLLIEYHTKKYVQRKALCVDLRRPASSATPPLWECKLNCLQSFMKIQVTRRFMVVLRNKKSEDFQLSFLVYDIDSGTKLYELPYHLDYCDFKDWFFPSRGDVMVVLSDEGDFYYDLANQETLEVDVKEDPRGMSNEEEDLDYDDCDVPVLQFQNGPGDTIIRYKPVNCGYELTVTLIDYRHNKSFQIAKFEGIKLYMHQYGWDKNFNTFVEYYDPHMCGTNVYRIW